MINKYPYEVVDELEKLGRLISAARKSRSTTQEQLAERALLGRSTIIAIEKGSPDVAIGNYMRALWAMNLHTDFTKNLEEDPEGAKLLQLSLPKRVRRSGSVK